MSLWARVRAFFGRLFPRRSPSLPGSAHVGPDWRDSLAVYDGSLWPEPGDRVWFKRRVMVVVAVDRPYVRFADRLAEVTMTQDDLEQVIDQYGLRWVVKADRSAVPPPEVLDAYRDEQTRRSRAGTASV